MRTWLLQAVRDPLRPWLATPQSLGAQPGIIAALHPWRPPLGLPPPLHCLVPGGGRPPAGTWGAGRHGFLLPMRVGMAVVRGQLAEAIRQSFARGAVALPAPRRP